MGFVHPVFCFMEGNAPLVLLREVVEEQPCQMLGALTASSGKSLGPCLQHSYNEFHRLTAMQLGLLFKNQHYFFTPFYPLKIAMQLLCLLWMLLAFPSNRNCQNNNSYFASRLIQFLYELQGRISQQKWNNKSPAILSTYVSSRKPPFRLKDTKNTPLAIQSNQCQISLLLLNSSAGCSRDETRRCLEDKKLIHHTCHLQNSLPGDLGGLTNVAQNDVPFSQERKTVSQYSVVTTEKKNAFPLDSGSKAESRSEKQSLLKGMIYVLCVLGYFYIK